MVRLKGYTCVTKLKACIHYFGLFVCVPISLCYHQGGRGSGRMGLLPDTLSCGLCMRRECRESFPHHRLQRKPLVNDPGMHHGTRVTHVPWCMSGSLLSGGGNTVPAFPAHMQSAILRIWQEAHVCDHRRPPCWLGCDCSGMWIIWLVCHAYRVMTLKETNFEGSWQVGNLLVSLSLVAVASHTDNALWVNALWFFFSF